MQAFRLCRSSYPAYDGEGARRVGGRWDSKGKRAQYMSENRSLAVPEILVHQFSALPDKYVLAAAEIPDDIPIEGLNPDALPDNWMTLIPREQHATKRIGDEWIERRESAVLAVPSVIVGELDYLLNPAHLDFQRIRFAEPVLFRFDLRFIARNQSVTPGEAKPQAGLV